jgi:Flp pilus assembly protein TadG
MRAARRSDEGQALVELAVYLPFLLGFVLACLQFAAIFFAYLSVLNSARDVGRWVAVHPHTTDASAIAQIRARLPSDLDSAALAISFSPACPTLTSGRCANRPVGSRLEVRMTYDARSALFVSDPFRLGPFDLDLPTSLPTYTLHLPVEPS